MGSSAVRLDLAVEGDAEELDALTRTLQDELLQTEIERVERASGGPAPPGAKAVDIASLGTLLVTVTSSAQALAAFVRVVRSWLSRRSEGTIRLELEGDSLELTHPSSEERTRVVELWIQRHAAPGRQEST